MVLVGKYVLTLCCILGKIDEDDILKTSVKILKKIKAAKVVSIKDFVQVLSPLHSKNSVGTVKNLR